MDRPKSVSNFKFENEGAVIEIQIEADGRAKCPKCAVTFKQLLKHLNSNKICKIYVNFETFQDEYKKFLNRRKQSEFRKRKLEIDPDELHNAESAKKRFNRAKILSSNPVELHNNENSNNNRLRYNNLASNPVELHNAEAKMAKKYRDKSLATNPEKLHRYELQIKRMQKLNFTRAERLKKFRRAVTFGPIFVCSSCHVKHFESNVMELDEKLRESLLEKYPDCYVECVREFVKIDINGKNKYYFCKTCIKYLKTAKIPPMSVCNGLEIEHSDDPELQLSELENNLIALRIMFQKIYYLPKSRWTALKDRVINIPIEKNDVINTIQQLPRLPAESGLVEIKLKRKLEYKNNHKQEYVNPDKIFKALEYLKASGHPGYKNFNSKEDYIKRCRVVDEEGYQAMFEDEQEVDELAEHLEPFQLNGIEETLTDEINDEEKGLVSDEEYYKKNDPVAKFQFNYDRSTCLTEKYPEVATDDAAIATDLNFAPGEGKYPADILMDKSWDINAFPMLYPSGMYGLNEEREKRLTDQDYFKQRLRNRNRKFIDNKAFLYSAVAYIERKQLQNNINLSYTRGKKTVREDGTVNYELDDAFHVFENIKSTPRFWRKAKYEMLAKLDNLGAFQIFFTLSSADMRWEENFTSILKERNIRIHYDFNTFETKVECVDPVTNEERTKNLQEYLSDDVDETLHELIRTNVLTAVMNFNQRFTAFKNEIMFGANNPMAIEYFSSKVEFQMRGAGHIHGVLWCDLNKFDNENGEEPDNEGYKFPGIKKIFAKIRRNATISDEEAQVLANFADAFSTCSLNPDEVGANVAKIAAQVNCHHHTFTCRKFCIKCRFNFPKFPIWKTIIARPRIEEKANIDKYTNTLNKVKTLIEVPEIIDDIMSKYEKKKETKEEYETNRKKRILELLDIAKVTVDDYLRALKYSKAGYNVILKRDLDEIYINSYNPEWIEAWDGNIDFSFCLDYYAVLTYITEYFCKTDTAMQELLKEAAKNIEHNKSQRERKILLSNTFLTHRQMGEAEALYKLFPNLKMKDSNVTCVFLQTGKKNERSKFLTSMDRECNWHDKVGVQVEGREGLMVEKPDIIDKYCRKHRSVGKITPSQFAKIYEATSRVPKRYQHDGEEDLDQDDEEFDENHEQNKCNIVMSYDNEFATKLP